MQRHSLTVGFWIIVLGIGVPYWFVDYSKLPLPDGLPDVGGS